MQHIIVSLIIFYSYVNVCECVSSVSTADGETDVGVLGSWPGQTPHSSQGEEEPGENVRVPRHQNVTDRQEREALITQRLVTADGTALLRLANRGKGKNKKSL